MKTIKIKRILALAAWFGAICMLLLCCSDELGVKQFYDFDLKTMPVQKRITVGQTAEIRCELVCEGNYEDAKFFIRYFQPDGKGILRLDDGRQLHPNDLYLLRNAVFRLYYTAQSNDRQVIDVYIENNAGQVIQKTFSFQNENSTGEDNDLP